MVIPHWSRDFLHGDVRAAKRGADEVLAVADRPLQQQRADERLEAVHVALQGPHRVDGAGQGVRRGRPRHQAARPHQQQLSVRDQGAVNKTFSSAHLRPCRL